MRNVINLYINGLMAKLEIHTVAYMSKERKWGRIQVFEKDSYQIFSNLIKNINAQMKKIIQIPGE